MELNQEQFKKMIQESIENCFPGCDSKLNLTLDECAKVTGIGRNKLTELIYRKDTDFPFFQVGVRFMVNKDLLIAWLQKVTQEHRQL